MKSKFKLWLMGLMVVILLGVGYATTKPAHAGYWITAYSVQFAGWGGGLPHYGAYFSGSNGSSQYFTGSSGAPAAYSSWDWTGSTNSILLLEKSWLFEIACGWSSCDDRWTGNNHHAYMAYH